MMNVFMLENIKSNIFSDWMSLFEEEQCINVQGSKISIIMKKNLDRVSVTAPQWFDLNDFERRI